MPSGTSEFSGRIGAFLVGLAALGLAACGQGGVETSTGKANRGLLQLAASATVAELSRERELTNVRYEDAPVTVRAAGFGGGHYLVVSASGGHGLHATRLTREGVLLDPHGIHLDSSAGAGAVVVHTSASWVVLWSVIQGSNLHTRCARILDDGTLLDPGGVELSGLALSLHSASYDGTNILVAGPDSAVLVDPSCHVVVPTFAFAPVSSRSSLGGFGPTRLSFDGGQFLALYRFTKITQMFPIIGNLNDALYLQAISRQGAPLGERKTVYEVDPARMVYRHSYAVPSFDIASVGPNSLITFAAHRLAPFDNPGNPVVPPDPPTIAYQTVSSSLELGPLQRISSVGGLVARGDEFVIVSSTADALLLTGVGPSGERTGVVPSGGVGTLTPLAASDGENVLVVGLYASSTGAVAIDRDFVRLAGSWALEQKAVQHGLPKSLAGGDQYLSVWAETGPRLRASRLDREGTVLDTPALSVADVHPPEDHLGGFDGASNGTDFLVAWSAGRYSTDNLYATRILGDGRLPEPDKILLATGCREEGQNFAGCMSASVASDGRDFLVAWESAPTSAAGEIRATRVTREGAVVDSPPLVVSELVPFRRTPKVAFDGTGYLVATTSGSSSSARLEIHRVRADGSIETVTDTPLNQYLAVTAFTWGKGQGLLALRSAEDDFGMRVDASGLIDGTPFPLGTGSSNAGVGLSWDGASYIVAWDHPPSSSEEPAVLARRITPSGTLLDGEGIEVANARGSAQRGASAASIHGRTLVTYTRFLPDHEIAGSQGRGRLLSFRTSDGGAGGDGGSGTAGDGGDSGCESATGGCGATGGGRGGRGGSSAHGGTAGSDAGMGGDESGEAGSRAQGGIGGASGQAGGGGSSAGVDGDGGADAGESAGGTGGSSAGAAGAGGSGVPDETGCSCATPGSAPGRSERFSTILSAIVVLLGVGRLRVRRR